MKKSAAALITILAALGLASPAASAQPPNTANQTFTIEFQGGGSGELTASGVVTADGRAIPHGLHDATFALPGGTVSITHDETRTSDSFNPTTCVESFTETGTFHIIEGTGRYAAATGGGTSSNSGQDHLRATRNGCSTDGSSFSAVIELQGNITLGP